MGNDIIKTKEVTSRDLATMVDAGMLTTLQRDQVGRVVEALPMLAQLPPTLRMSGALAAAPNARMAVAFRTPQDRAIEILARFQATWGPAQVRVHQYREKYLKGRVTLAKLAKARRRLETVEDEDDREILKAEIDLEEGRLEALEAELATGQQELLTELSLAAKCGEQYAAALEAAGRTELSAADILRSQVAHIARSLWYRIAKEYRVAHIRSADPREQGVYQIQVGEETAMFCHLLSIPVQEIRQHVGSLADQRANWDRVNAGNACTFDAHFEGWLRRTADQYIDRIRTAIENDTGLLERLRMALPEITDQGRGGRGEVQERDSVVW